MRKKTYTSSAIDEHIGQRVQLRRLMMGLSQKDLAKICGITFQQLQKYESAGNRIPASRLFELSTALETPVSFFFMGLPGHMQSMPHNGKASHIAEQNENDPLSKNESLQLINLYWRLANDGQRKMIMQMLKTLNNMDA